MTDKTVVYTGGYVGNTPDDIVSLLNAACRVSFREAALLSSPEEADQRLVAMFGEDGKSRVTFRVTVEKLP